MFEILEEIHLRCGNQTKCLRNDLRGYSILSKKSDSVNQADRQTQGSLKFRGFLGGPRDLYLVYWVTFIQVQPVLCLSLHHILQQVYDLPRFIHCNGYIVNQTVVQKNDTMIA